MNTLNEKELNEVSGGLITGDGVTIFEVGDVFYDKKVPNTSYTVTSRTVVRALTQGVPVDITNSKGIVSGAKPAAYLLNSCSHNK